MAEHARRAAINATGVLSVVVGAALFAVVLWKVGPGEVWAGIAQMRWWLAAVVLLGGLRFLSRAAAWSACVEPPHRLPVSTAFAGVVAGDTIGNVTPLGPLLGEPAKAAYIRGILPTGAALTALAIENLLYTLSAAAVIAAGTLAFLALNPPLAARRAGEIAVGLIALMFVVALFILWRRPALLSRVVTLAATRSPRAESQAGRVRLIEEEIYTFASRRRGAVAVAILFECLFHALGVLEAHLTLTVINGTAPPLLASFILETANRLLTVAFKFIPFQWGVGELGTAVVTDALGLGSPIGVTLSVVRKARMTVWALVGAGLLVRAGVRPRPAPGVQ